MLTNKNIHALRAAVLAYAKPAPTTDQTCKLISKTEINYIFEKQFYSLSHSETEFALKSYLDTPVVVGGSFVSGCSLTRFNDVVNALPEYPAGQYFLPSLEVSRSNTIKQAERALSRAFKERTVTVRNESMKVSDNFNTFHLHLGSVQTDKKSENLSEQKCSVNVYFDSQTEQITHIDFISEQGLDNENKIIIEQAFDNAQGQINSVIWGNAWRVLNQAFEHRVLSNQTYLCESVLALSIIDYFISVGIKCGQHVYRADQPQNLVEWDLSEQITKMLDKAKSAKNYKASEVDKLSSIADTISRLKKSLNMASDTLDAQVEAVKAEWENVKKRAEDKLKKSGYVLTPQGQAFLTRKPDTYIVMNVHSENFQALKDQVLVSEDNENAFVKITKKLLHEPISLTDCTELFMQNEQSKIAFTVLSQNGYAAADQDLFSKLQNYSSMNKSPDNTLLEYNLIHKAIL